MTPEEKALELVAENRVVLIEGGAIVAGHHGHYDVTPTKQGVECSCPARVPLCAHALAAMVLWAERPALHKRIVLNNGEVVKPPW